MIIYYLLFHTSEMGDFNGNLPIMAQMKLKVNVGIDRKPFPLPGHSTVDGKVKGVGETNEGVDNQNNIFGDIVIHEVESKTIINL